MRATYTLQRSWPQMALHAPTSVQTRPQNATTQQTLYPPPPPVTTGHNRHLKETPESNTGYDGSTVWKFIHSTIAFQTDVSLPGNAWKSDFNRAVSGLHSSIHCHVIADMERTGEWRLEGHLCCWAREPQWVTGHQIPRIDLYRAPVYHLAHLTRHRFHPPTTDPELALAQYRRRLRDQPNAIANMHYTYKLVLSAINTIRNTLEFRSVHSLCVGLGFGPYAAPVGARHTVSCHHQMDHSRLRAPTCCV